MSKNTISLYMQEELNHRICRRFGIPTKYFARMNAEMKQILINFIFAQMNTPRIIYRFDPENERTVSSPSIPSSEEIYLAFRRAFVTLRNATETLSVQIQSGVGSMRTRNRITYESIEGERIGSRSRLNPPICASELPSVTDRNIYDPEEFIVHSRNLRAFHRFNGSNDRQRSVINTPRLGEMERSARISHGSNYRPFIEPESSNEMEQAPRFPFINHNSRHPVGLYASSYSRTLGKPFFDFIGTKHFVFDLEKDNLQYIIEQIKIFKGHLFQFNTIHHAGNACGEGATRQVYHKLCNDMVNTIMTNTHPYFMDINPDHDFWSSDENIECFVMLIGMIISSGCLLPYHLPPALLEIISNKILTSTELSFFMEKIDPDGYSYVKHIDPADFPSLGTGFDSIDDYYKSKVIGSIDDKKMDIYRSIAKHFELFDSFHDYDILIIDDTFSGSYTITADQVSSIIHIDNEYGDMWRNFIHSLSETEIKQMLILFGNTLSLDNSYTVHVSNSDIDIQITTCFRTIRLNKKLFDNPENLNNLKIYFSDFDTISDYNIVQSRMEEVE